MSTQTELQQLDAAIKDLSDMVDEGKALDRLRKNRDFRKIIDTGYMREEAIRLVHLKGNSNVQDPRQQANIDKQIAAIGCLADFLELIAVRAEGAAEALGEAEEARAELEAEAD